MGTIKENPNDRQIREAKSTRENNIEKSKAQLNQAIKEKKPKKVVGDKDEGAANEAPFDAKFNNMHLKR
jgi:uncharacterized lipoprotein YddW (UPF0748 family)